MDFRDSAFLFYGFQGLGLSLYFASQGAQVTLLDRDATRGEAIAKEMCRPVESVQKMAEQIFATTRRTGPWTAGEVERLKQYAERIRKDLGDGSQAGPGRRPIGRS